MTHREMTKHIRTRIAKAGIKVRVRLYESCGDNYIQVFGVTPDAQFSEAEQREIRIIAQVNRLTLAQGMPIDLERMTNSTRFDFVYSER